MPAYRSPAEAEIRSAVVERIRKHRPNARIIHEINVSTYGPNRIDLIAVDVAEIIAVEIKSSKDKLDRLEAQVNSMKGAAHHVIAAIHEKFLVEQVTHVDARHYGREGRFYLRTLPDKWDYAVEAWVFPEVRRCLEPTWQHDSLAKWQFPQAKLETPLPAAAIDLLWRDELFALCGALRVSATARTNMTDMVRSLRWHCTGKELTRGICAMLRSRKCVEADPEIHGRVAA